MHLKTDNPFDGWLNQCFGSLACDGFGMEVDPESPAALTHCAVGWVARTGLLAEVGGGPLWRAFNEWYYAKWGRSIIEDNDVHHKPPAWFRGQWNAFLDEPIQYTLGNG